jgi:hypothetical protein
MYHHHRSQLARLGFGLNSAVESCVTMHPTCFKRQNLGAILVYIPGAVNNEHAVLYNSRFAGCPTRS